MGVGIGGDYPLSAIISSEFAATKSRGRLMTAVFAFQGWGQLSSSSFRLVPTCCLMPRVSGRYHRSYRRLSLQE